MARRFVGPSSMGLLFLAGALFWCVTALHAQAAGEKVVRVKDVEQITDPVLISNISVAGKPVECGLFIKPPAVIQTVTPFMADDNWFQQMAISLVNRTNKTIVYGGILFRFLDVGDCKTQPCAEAEIHLGQMPAADAYDGRTGLPLKPERSGQPPLD